MADLAQPDAVINHAKAILRYAREAGMTKIEIHSAFRIVESMVALLDDIKYMPERVTVVSSDPD